MININKLTSAGKFCWGGYLNAGLYRTVWKVFITWSITIIILYYEGCSISFAKKTYLLEPLWSKCCLNLFRFSNLALILCLQHHSSCQTYHKASTKKPWKCGLRKFELCRLFVWFLWIFSAQTFLRSANILHFTFSLLVHL